MIDLDAVKADRQLWRECACPTHTMVKQLVAEVEELRRWSMEIDSTWGEGSRATISYDGVPVFIGTDATPRSLAHAHAPADTSGLDSESPRQGTIADSDGKLQP